MLLIPADPPWSPVTGTKSTAVLIKIFMELGREKKMLIIHNIWGLSLLRSGAAVNVQAANSRKAECSSPIDMLAIFA